MCFSAAGEEPPDCVSEIQQSGTARLSFDDQEYQKVEQICYMQYIRHTQVYTKNVFFFHFQSFSFEMAHNTTGQQQQQQLMCR